MSPKRHVNLKAATRTQTAILGERLIFRSGKAANNRFLKSAMTELLSTYDPENPTKHGLPTEAILNIYEKWGNGRFGMILTGNVGIDKTHLESAGNAIIFKEGDSVERRTLFTKWAKNMKQDGALAILQLSHAGRQTPYLIEPNPFSASDVQLEKEVRFSKYGKPKPLTIEQVKTEVIDRFVYAAKFAYGCGFDGIELHAAHGYLLSQFSSPTTNKRIDKYGGSLQNRIRVILEIHDAIRAAIPNSFIIGVKTNSVEFQAEGTTVDDAKEMCEIYEKTGFDFVELSGGTYEQLAFQHFKESTRKREAFFLEFSEKIRPVFKNTIVYVTGGFRTVKGMVDAIESDATQGIGIGRPVTAEPDFPKKILNEDVTGAIYNKIEQEDTVVSVIQSNIQIEQMGRTSLKSVSNDPTVGISDFSDDSTVERFFTALGGFVGEIQKLAEQGKPVQGVPVFD